MANPLQIVVAQITPVKGDYAASLERIGALFRQVAALHPAPDVLHLPETALSGYFLEGGVREVAVTAGTLAADLSRVYQQAGSGSRSLDVAVGFYERWRDTFHNSAMYVTLSGDAPVIRHVHRKNFLPTYGLFDEERFVERGHEIRAFDTPWGRAAMLVCEDAWHSLAGTIAALDEAQIIFICSAAPARGTSPREDAVPGPDSVARWERLVRDIAEEHGVYTVLANLVGNEGGKLFAGGSLVVGPHGDIRARAALWEESLLVAPLDLDEIARARADMPLLSDLRTAIPHLVANLGGVGVGSTPALRFDAQEEPREQTLVHPAADAATAHRAVAVAKAGDAVAQALRALEIDAPLVERWLTTFLRDEMRQRGFTKGIVALSGGVDSAVTAYLAALALGPGNVVALRLPYRTSSPESLEHAGLIIERLGLLERTIDISGAVDGYLQHEPDASPARRGNVMARIRMTALFDQSVVYQAIPLGTGNKSERLMGYFTWHADDSPPLNPIGDLFKTQVWALARHLGVPSAIVDKPATADLIRGQTDEDDLGISYPRADAILHLLLSGFPPATIARASYSPEEVETVRRRLDGTHWKRRLPTVAMLSGTAIGESYLRPVDY
jgi:NAD+ synthase (glutamine-hydrolysing)